MNRPSLLAFIGLLAAGTLAADPSPRSDVNGDGRLDGADLDLMRTLFFTADARADLDRNGQVNFVDLAILKAARAGDVPRAGGGPGGMEIPPAPSVYLLPETQAVTVGDTLAVDIYWDFTGEAALGGGTDFTWDPSAFSLVSIVFDDNFGTGPGQFDPAFTRCDNEPCSGSGFIDALATGNFNGLGDPGPIYIATLTFDTLRTGAFSIAAAEDDGPIAGPFISAIDFLPYPNLQFAGATVDIQPGPPAPRIRVEPLNVAFPDTFVGDTSSDHIRVVSAGELPLTISDVAAPLPPFALAADGCTGLVLAPDESCDLTVEFSPTATGPFASTVTVTSDDADQPEVQVTLTGTGIVETAPDIAARRDIGLPDARVSQTTQAVLSVHNQGSDTLNIAQVGVANPLEPPFTIAFDGCSGEQLSPGATCPIALNFTPTEVGHASGDFDIPSNDPDTPSFVVGVRGTGERRIALTAFGIQAEAGGCNNRTTGQSIVTPLGGGTTLPCEGFGLSADTGDALSVQMRGAAQSTAELGGRALGMTVDRVRCVNVTTGQSVNINPAVPSIDWNCVAQGLTVTPGDTVSMTVFGDAL